MAQVNKSLLQIYRALWRDIQTPKKQFDDNAYGDYGETKKKGAQWGTLYAAQLNTCKEDMNLLLKALHGSNDLEDQRLAAELDGRLNLPKAP